MQIGGLGAFGLGLADALRLQTAHAKGLPLKAHWERFRQLLVVDALHVRGHLLMLDNLKA